MFIFIGAVFDHIIKLGQAVIGCEVPYLPHRVVVRGRKSGVRNGCTLVWMSTEDDSSTLHDLIIRSASKKFLNKLAMSKSSLNNFWNNFWGRTFHAIVSVIAVKIQFNSPIGVRLSLGRPGILSIDSWLMPEIIVWVQYLTSLLRLYQIIPFQGDFNWGGKARRENVRGEIRICG